MPGCFAMCACSPLVQSAKDAASAMGSRCTIFAMQSTGSGPSQALSLLLSLDSMVAPEAAADERDCSSSLARLYTGSCSCPYVCGVAPVLVDRRRFSPVRTRFQKSRMVVNPASGASSWHPNPSMAYRVFRNVMCTSRIDVVKTWS